MVLYSRWHRQHVWQKQKTAKQLKDINREFMRQHLEIKKQTELDLSQKLARFTKWVKEKQLILIVLMGVIGYTILISSIFFLAYQKTILSFKVSPSVVNQTEFRAAKPTEILLPNLNRELPIVSGVIVEGIWQTASDRPTHLDTSARPGEAGNIVIYGHNKTDIFGSLKQLSRGQVISLTNEQSQKYEYVIQSIEVVSPDKIEAVLPTDHEVLTVYTCTGPFDGKRLVIQAVPLY